MLEKKYKNIIYFISLTIIAAIAAQVYWNLKNFEVNKQQMMNQIHSSFDLAVEKYYNEIAKDKILNLMGSDTLFEGKQRVIFRNIDSANATGKPLNFDSHMGENVIKIRTAFPSDDSIYLENIDLDSIEHISVFRGNLDSISDIQKLSAKVMLSFKSSGINLQKIDSLFKNDLSGKNIDIQYGFNYHDAHNQLKNGVTIDYKLDSFPSDYLSWVSSSSFIPPLSNLELRYTGLTPSVFKRIFLSVLLSLVLSGIIIWCLIFLLKIIFNQKQLSEVKNDLISNMTHEFKSPIATISAAMEGMRNFNVIQNPVKTNEYLDISTHQLTRLNNMVEHLLETASLHTDQLELDKKRTNLTALIKNCVEKMQLMTNEKRIIFDTKDQIDADIDRFHFENSINNILDNAIKYGGDLIEVKLTKSLEITIKDNGSGISKNHRDKIFEQFYRIPTGNRHDIKGFGIGLYYTRKIIEKHGGTISADESYKGLTIIKIQL